MSEHTPGPWRIGSRGRVGSIINGEAGELVADAWGGAANAHLISAAPDLLASVQELTAGAPSDGSAANAVYARARAAIAKAEGKSE